MLIIAYCRTRLVAQVCAPIVQLGASFRVWCAELAELRRKARATQAEFAAQERDYAVWREEQRRRTAAQNYREREEGRREREEAYQLEL